MRKRNLLFLFLFPLGCFAQVDTLMNVEVKASRPEFGKPVFYPSANLTNLGGNLQDVLANIPSIYVAGDGSIQYRGSQSLTIYFDGKPSGILASSRANALSLFPADRIEYIEIISAPGAKYSAEGSSGILNIVLKKGDYFHIPVGLKHQMCALEDTELFEFSTQHFDDDSYRIEKGD